MFTKILIWLGIKKIPKTKLRIRIMENRLVATIPAEWSRLQILAFNQRFFCYAIKLGYDPMHARLLQYIYR